MRLPALMVDKEGDSDVDLETEGVAMSSGGRMSWNVFGGGEEDVTGEDLGESLLSPSK